MGATLRKRLDTLYTWYLPDSLYSLRMDALVTWAHYYGFDVLMCCPWQRWCGLQLAAVANCAFKYTARTIVRS
eukprot:COSAG02_NODE_5911_length_3942_cov_2.643247_3_plen_73_part_00